MNGRLEIIDGQNWESFVAAPVAVLMLGKSDCEACAAWTAELSDWLEGDEAFRDVRFGKLEHFERRKHIRSDVGLPGLRQDSAVPGENRRVMGAVKNGEYGLRRYFGGIGVKTPRHAVYRGRGNGFSEEF